MEWFVVALAVILAAAVATMFLRRRLPVEHQPTLEVGPETSTIIATVDEVSLVTPCFNPLSGLSFEDSLDGEKFALQVQTNTEHALAESVKSSGFQFGNLSLQALSAGRDGFVVTFEKGTAEFVRTADGIYKAQTRGPKGAFQEIGNIDQLGTWAHRAAGVAAITVATANLISNADASKKLGKLMEGQDRLFAYRSIDQFAALKTAYEDLREELSASQNPKELNKIRSRIRNIRHVLMEEAKHDLQQLKLLYPDRSGFLGKSRKVAADWWKRKLTAEEQRRHEALSEYRGKLFLARQCVKFEDLAASVSDSADHQAILLREAETQLVQMLPRYQELERELQSVPSSSDVLERLFAGPRATDS